MPRTSRKPPVAFISYSTKDKDYGGAVKSVLDSLGIESFLAHDDLRVSDAWEKQILQELGRCNIFVPILSKNFVASDWCSQETGIVVRRRGVLIVPLSVDGTMPFGFIRHVQGQKVTLDDIDVELLVKPLVERFPRHILPHLIERLNRAFSFRDAEALVAPLVPYFDKFDPVEANRFAELCVENAQIWAAHLCQDKYLPEFLRVQGENLNATLRRRLKYQVEKQEWYRPRQTA